jgi:hypothetical protein
LSGNLALCAVLSLGLLGLAGCQRTAPAADAKADSAEPAGKEEGVTLTAEQVRKVGIVTEPARAVDYAPETVGYGVVVPHDAVATAVAELATAQAAQAQSRAVSARARSLAGTSGALAADVVESAARQEAADKAQLALAERRLSTVIGAALPGSLSGGSALQDLASGRIKLLRATFPLGAIRGATPVSLRAARLDAQSPGSGQSDAGWKLSPVWNAPADATLPGRSFFALLKGGDAGEGERLLVWAPGAGPAERGVTVPASAVVISGGRYWCYLQTNPGHYVRREVATDKPLADGYVVTSGIAAGDQVVTAAAGLLLAREMNPSTEAD